MIEWKRLDVERPWKSGAYLIWNEYSNGVGVGNYGGLGGDCFTDNLLGAIDGVTHWAEINPPTN